MYKLKAKSQATILKEITNSLDLIQGDQLEINEEDGKIVIVPVAIYPVKVIKNLKKSIDEIRVYIKKRTSCI